MAGAGGEPRPFLDLEEGEDSHDTPRSSQGVERRELVDGVSPHYVPTGHLVFGRAGSLWAAPFDLDALDLSGEPVPILEGVTMGAEGAGAPGPPALGFKGNARWSGWIGKGKRIHLAHPRDATSCHASRPTGQASRSTCVIKRTTSGSGTWPSGRCGGSPPIQTLTIYPVWTPDSLRVAFTSGRAGSRNLFWKAADGTGTVERLTDNPNRQYPHAFSPNGTQFVFRENNPETLFDLAVLSMEGDRPTEAILATESNELNPELSPNGRWLAYQSDASGQYEIYVQPFPDVNQGLEQISTDGGDPALVGPQRAGTVLSERCGADGGARRNGTPLHRRNPRGRGRGAVLHTAPSQLRHRSRWATLSVHQRKGPGKPRARVALS